jgi:hypothetical protein
MRIVCRIDKALPKTVRDVARRRAALKLSRFADLIAAVHVSVRDINGPRGGIGLRCRILIQLQRGPDVIVQETAASVKDAIAGAFDRAARSVARRSQRQTDRYQRGRGALSSIR